MRLHPLLDGIAITLLRFALMVATLELAGAAGVGGWHLGLVTNVAVTILAIALMTRRRLWRVSGATTAWRSWIAAAALVPLVVESVSWALPAGLIPEEPGYLLWAITLHLVGVNEELISRGVILSRLREAYRPPQAVTLTAVLFGLQHLSAFALTSRGAGDILMNVFLSGVYGFALAAYQFRFRWIWPLILVHAMADFTTVLAAEPLPDLLVGVSHVLLLAFGIILLRGLPDSSVRSSPTPAAVPR